MGVSLLVVDGAEESRRHIDRLLSRERVRLVEATSVSDALGILSGDLRIDVALVEFDLSDGWGLELIAPLLGWPHECAGVVAMSARARADARARCAYSAGAYDLLIKPLSDRSLHATIRGAHDRTLRYRRRQKKATAPKTHETDASIKKCLQKASTQFELTPREALAVEALVVREHSDKEISGVLGISLTATKRLMGVVRTKTGSTTRAGIVRAVLSLT